MNEFDPIAGSGFDPVCSRSAPGGGHARPSGTALGPLGMQVSSSPAVQDGGGAPGEDYGTTVAILDPNFIETVFDRIRAGGTA
ncbi:MAG: hypothetical protein ACYC4P_11275 [Thermoanaerobaculia bacterium]